MAFHLKADESVRKGIRRIVRQEIDDALERLTVQSVAKQQEAVHDVRKAFKKIRAVLRLVRDDLGPKVYRADNLGFRDAGRPLTEVRDAEVLIQALGQLAEHFAGQVVAKSWAEIRHALRANYRAVCQQVLEESRAFQKVAARIKAARQRLPDWKIRRGWSVLRSGFERVYRNGRQALIRASRDPSVENLHELRKQTKYLWHQLEVLEPLWPQFLRELGDQAHQLTTYLGDDHDLVILRQKVLDDIDRFTDRAPVETLVALIDRRRAELQHEAHQLGERFYQDKPKAFIRRFKGYWKLWRTEQATGAAAEAKLIREEE